LGIDSPRESQRCQNVHALADMVTSLTKSISQREMRKQAIVPNSYFVWVDKYRTGSGSDRVWEELSSLLLEPGGSRPL